MVGFEKLACIESEFGVLDIYPRFAVGTLDKAVDRKREGFLEWITESCDAHYSEPFGYIGNRINRNAGDPSVFGLVRKRLPLWSSFALVSYSLETSSFFHLESLALGDVAHALFNDLEAAMLWSDNEIRELRGEEKKLG